MNNPKADVKETRLYSYNFKEQNYFNNMNELGREPVSRWETWWHFDFSPVITWIEGPGVSCLTLGIENCELINECFSSHQICSSLLWWNRPLIYHIIQQTYQLNYQKMHIQHLNKTGKHWDTMITANAIISYFYSVWYWVCFLQKCRCPNKKT